MVVVTYKRAEVLKDCLDALSRSVYPIEEVHVVVNSEDSPTLNLIKNLQEKNLLNISYRIFDNIGPAGGFYEGLKKFLESDYDFVWLMDDDIVSTDDCLRELIKCSAHHPYVFSRVKKTTGEEAKGFGWWGVLISREIVKKAGLPRKEFFYWTEDTEYLQNRMIRKYRIIPHRCEKAVVTHLHNRNKLRSSWFYYYTIRNTLFYRLNIFPLNYRGIFILGKLFGGLLYRILFKEDRKLKKLRLFGLGILHAFQGKLGKTEALHQRD